MKRQTIQNTGTLVTTELKLEHVKPVALILVNYPCHTKNYLFAFITDIVIDIGYLETFTKEINSVAFAKVTRQGNQRHVMHGLAGGISVRSIAHLIRQMLGRPFFEDFF